MLTRSRTYGNLVTNFLAGFVVLVQGISAYRRVDFHEEEENAKFRDLKTEECSDNAEYDCDNQEKDVKDKIRNEERLGMLK